MENHCPTEVRPKNLLVPVLLMSLHQWSSYGYELMQRTANFWETAVNSGTLYRTLRQMENNGDIKSTWDTTKPGAARRMYSITEAGEAYLDLWIKLLQQQQRNTEAFLKLYQRILDRDD